MGSDLPADFIQGQIVFMCECTDQTVDRFFELHFGLDEGFYCVFHNFIDIKGLGVWLILSPIVGRPAMLSIIPNPGVF
jgi:hypothetical protein